MCAPGAFLRGESEDPGAVREQRTSEGVEGHRIIIIQGGEGAAEAAASGSSYRSLLLRRDIIPAQSTVPSIHAPSIGLRKRSTITACELSQA